MPKQLLPEQLISKITQDNKRLSLEARVWQRLQLQMILCSAIDSYFEKAAVIVDESVADDGNWVFSWWTHRDEYPRVAATARDFLVILAAEVQLREFLAVVWIC